MWRYEWTQGGYRVVPDEAEMVRLVYRLYADGMKIEHIRKEVEAAGYASFRGKVSHKFISRMLDDERYPARHLAFGSNSPPTWNKHRHAALI